MLLPLDLSALLEGDRMEGDYLQLRPKLLGGLDPVDFLKKSVERGRSEGFEAGSPEEYLDYSAKIFEESKGKPLAASFGDLRKGFKEALSCRLSSREVFQLWYCLRTLGLFPPAESAKTVLGVALETFSGRSPFFLYCDADKSSFAVWEGGSGRFPWYAEGEATGLVVEVLEAASAALEMFGVEDNLPASPMEGELLLTVLTPSGWRSFRLLETEADVGPVGVIYSAFVRMRGLFLQEAAIDEGVGASGFAFEDTRWVYPALWLRALAFCVDVLVFSLFFFLFCYAVYAFQGGLTLLLACGLIFLGLFLFPFYLAFFESSKSHTSFGKRFFSLYVVSTSAGTGTGYFQALARNFCKCYLSWSFGWLWGMFHPYKRMFHDVMVDTVVIFDEKEAELLEQLKEELKDS